MDNEETYIYSSENILKHEQEFQNIFNNWKNKNNITSKELVINNDILSLENDFNTNVESLKNLLLWHRNI